MPSDPYRAHVDALLALGPQRVWSLIITIFGDMARGKDQWIDGPALTSLMSELGVKPDALRVALHRLRSDDWLISEKSGRTSRHSLSAKARLESEVAASRIYGMQKRTSTVWHVILTQETCAPPPGYLRLAPRLSIGNDQTKAPTGALILEPQNLPGWLRAQITPEEVMLGYAALHPALKALASWLAKKPELNDVQIATLRCVTVHNWRRLILRHPDLPPELFLEAWRGGECADLVSDILDALPKPQLG